MNVMIENGIVFRECKKVLNQNEFKIVGIGRLKESKNFQLAIRALSKVKFEFKFYILGQGIYENKLRELIKNLNLEDKVKLVGFVYNPQDYIFSSNMQLLPSLLDGFLLALIEGIYYGKMVFAIDTANHKDVLGEDFIVEDDEDLLAKKLDEVYENYQEYVKKFEQIKHKSKKYDIKNVSQKYINEYKSLIQGFNL